LPTQLATANWQIANFLSRDSFQSHPKIRDAHHQHHHHAAAGEAVFALEAAFLFRPLVLFRKKITPALIFAALVPETT